MPSNVTSPSQGSRYFCSAYIAQAALWVKEIKFGEQISCDDAQTIQKSWVVSGFYLGYWYGILLPTIIYILSLSYGNLFSYASSK